MYIILSYIVSKYYNIRTYYIVRRTENGVVAAAATSSIAMER